MSHRHAVRVSCLLAVSLALGACAQTPPQPEPARADGFKAGLSLDTEPATSADLGVPVYPGARPLLEGEDDKASVRLSLWGGSAGFKLSAAKFQSRDGAERVSRFYRSALARYGDLLDCSAISAPRGDSKDGTVLSCGSDKVEAGAQVYKVGVPKNFRAVTVKALSDGTTQIGIARVEMR
ncbi:MAG: hypothetical protein ABW220_10415 [Burkholderiaceae bacterium]